MFKTRFVVSPSNRAFEGKKTVQVLDVAVCVFIVGVFVWQSVMAFPLSLEQHSSSLR